MQVPFLGEIPLDPSVRESGDSGTPTALSAADSAAGAAFREIAEKIVANVESAIPASSLG